MKKALFIKLLFTIGTLLLFSCSATKYVPEDEYLLNTVKIVRDKDKTIADNAELYVKQQANSKWLNLYKPSLYIYSLSGRDTTKWINRTLRRMGEAPVIYNREKADDSRLNIQRMMQNEGFLHASVKSYPVPVKKKNNQIDVYYYLKENQRYTIGEIDSRINDDIIAGIIKENESKTLLATGQYFSISNLDAERSRIVALLKDSGYYKFTKDMITFVADTAKYSLNVNLTMNILKNEVNCQSFRRYTINKIVYVSEPNIFKNMAVQECDTMQWGIYTLLYNDKPYLRRSKLEDCTFVVPGEFYNLSNVNKTYNSFAQLSALRHTSLHMVEHPDTALLDCYIIFEKNKRYSAEAELEITNTKKDGVSNAFAVSMDNFFGNFGLTSSVAFSNRNLFRGSELLSFRLSWTWETIKGLSDYLRENFIEYDAELSLKSKGLFAPIIPAMKDIPSIVSLKYNSQRRPEYDRLNASASLSFVWNNTAHITHKLEIPGVNYIYVPWIDEEFKKNYLDSITNRKSILKYNYENLLITKLGYTFSYKSALDERLQKSSYSVRAAAESSGNLFGCIKGLFKNDIPYAQYVKGDFDITALVNVDNRNSLVFHTGVGIAYPYGNSTILPFEKRYFAGGANFMRGWMVRTLGPGNFKGKDKNIDYINQTGDVKLSCSIELRSYLFWKLYSALFVDVGNIWTLKNYEEQPGGQFDIKFYEDVAVSYGVGLRFKLDLFVLRIDAGMKAVNPAERGEKKYPIIRPNLSRDFALHFAVGYPF